MVSSMVRRKDRAHYGQHLTHPTPSALVRQALGESSDDLVTPEFSRRSSGGVYAGTVLPSTCVLRSEAGVAGVCSGLVGW